MNLASPDGFSQACYADVTQSIEEVPFDLTLYRLLEYNTHFADIEKAKEQSDCLCEESF